MSPYLGTSYYLWRGGKDSREDHIVFRGGGGEGRRISCRRQSKKWDCRELTANLLPTRNEGGGGGKESPEYYRALRGNLVNFIAT